jgi:hypothetical protein
VGAATGLRSDEAHSSSSAGGGGWGEEAIFWEGRGLPPDDLTATLDLTLIRTVSAREREAVVPTKEEDSGSDSGTEIIILFGPLGWEWLYIHRYWVYQRCTGTFYRVYQYTCI